VWFTVVDSNIGSELTTPNSVAEFTDAYYTAASTSNNVRAGPGGSTTQGDETFVKCQFATAVDPALATQITLTFEGYWLAACTGTMYAYNTATSAWDIVGTQAFATSDGTMTCHITTDAGDYISGGYVLWGVYGAAPRQRAYVDFLEVVIDYATPFADQESNTLNWTHDGTDVDHYNIYRSAAEGGSYTLIDFVPVGTNTYMDVDMGQADATYWWYKVMPVDPLGNEYTGDIAKQEPGGSVEPPVYYDIDLTGRSAGDWVFVSYPIGISGSIDVILDDAVTDWDVAKWYDGTTQTWKTYRKGATTNTFTTINNQMGVWLHLTAVGGAKLTTAQSGLYPSTAVQITLTKGWNMVGYPSQTPTPAGTALTGTGATIISVYSATTPYITDYTTLNSVTMSNGHAYWVFVPATVVWTVPL
jgi:hypothetical protein